METVNEIQKRHKSILMAVNQVVSILQPVHTVPGKVDIGIMIEPINIERLAKNSDLISSDFCRVRVINKHFEAGRGEGNSHDCTVVNLSGENFGFSFAPQMVCYIKKKLETKFKQAESLTKRASKAKPRPLAIKPAKQPEISQATELRAEIMQKEKTAVYLYGKRRGPCWGSKTGADDKRENELERLRAKLRTIETRDLSIKDDNLLKNGSKKLPDDSIKSYICTDDTIKPITQNDELKTVNFQIEGKYIEQIHAGAKIEDYRAINPVNAKKLCDHIDKKDLGPDDHYVTHNKEIWRVKKDLTHVRFFNGYKTDRKELLCELKDLQLNTYRKFIPEGMKPGTSCFTLFLGQIVVSKNFK